MKKLFFLILASMMLFSCGGDPESEANDLAANENYLAAVKIYKKQVKEDPEKADYYGTMAMIYQIKNGDKIYNRLYRAKPSNAISAYITNYNKAESIRPENIDTGASPKLVNALLDFAQALYDTEPENSVQASQYESLMFAAIDEATEIDPENPDIVLFKENVFIDKFNEAVDSGDKHMADAKKLRDDYEYILAERAYVRALRYDKNDEGTIQALADVREKNLLLWNPDYPLLLAVDMKKQKGNWAFGLSLKNNLDVTYILIPHNFSMVLKDGTVINYNEKLNADYQQKDIKNIPMKKYKQLQYTIVFKYGGGKADLGKLVYQYDDNTVIEKYFP